MKRINKNEDQIIALFVLKSFVVSVISIIAFSLLSSFTVLKLDLGDNAINILSVFVLLLSSILTSYISLGGIKNNGALIGVFSIIPLVIFSLFNLIFNENTIILFIIKCLLVTLSGALFGILRVNYNRRIKV